jgi:DNA ligase (NAD+)
MARRTASAKGESVATIAVDELTAAQAEAEHARLEAEIGAHDKRYYQEDAPTVSDAEYDALRRRYAAIEARFPDLRTPESLSLKVGVAPTGRFSKLRHAVPMLSLDNAFSEHDVVDFVDRIRRFLRLGNPSAVPLSNSGRMCGWLSAAVVLISCTNRSAPSTAASSGFRTLIATLRSCLRSAAR